LAWKKRKRNDGRRRIFSGGEEFFSFGKRKFSQKAASMEGAHKKEKKDLMNRIKEFWG